jgi:nucleotide-binding universal stress UspA family protein
MSPLADLLYLGLLQLDAIEISQVETLRVGQCNRPSGPANGGPIRRSRPIKERVMYQRVLVPVDGSPTAEHGLREAIGLATGQNTRLLFLHVVDDYTMLIEMSSAAGYEEMIRGLRQYGLEVLAKAKRAAEAASVHCETLLREVTGKRIADVIVDQARQHSCDLIVMGTHGRSGFSRLTLGSAAEGVARTSPVPVLLVRLDEAKS